MSYSELPTDVPIWQYMSQWSLAEFIKVKGLQAYACGSVKIATLSFLCIIYLLYDTFVILFCATYYNQINMPTEKKLI